MSVETTSSCPTGDELARVLADEAHALRDHVEGCEACQVRLAALVMDGVGGALVREVRELSGPAPSIVAADVPAIEGIRILRELHRGGQGIVYEATVVATGERVAVKSLLAGRWATSKEVRRFEREVELVAELDHPHIVALHEAGRAADGAPYYSMDLVDGTPLDRFVRTREEAGRPLSLDERLALFVTIGSAVEYAHRHGVIHRDLKPSNVLIDADGQPHLLDFGLAKSLEPGAERTLTRTGDFVGSPAWSAPEQVRGTAGAIDTRTDVYTLGLILYLLVTGHHAYPIDGTLMSVVDRVLHTPPTPLRRYLKQRNPNLAAILRRALEKEQDERYATVDALLEDCRRLRSGVTVVARRSSASRAWRSMRRHPWLSLGLTVVFAVLGTATLLTSRRVGLLEYRHAREVAASIPDIEQAHMHSERRLWESILTDAPYRSARTGSAFPAALPFHWSLRNYYQRVPVLRRGLIRNARLLAFHPTRDECLAFSREVVFARLTLPDLEALELPPGFEGAQRVVFSPDGSSAAVLTDEGIAVERTDAPVWTVPVDAAEFGNFFFSDATHIALQSRSSASVWDVRRHTRVLERDLSERAMLRPCFEQFLILQEDRSFVLADDRPLSLERVQSFDTSTNQLHAVFRDEGGLNVWDGIADAPVRVAFETRPPAQVSNDGRWVVHASGSRIQVLDRRAAAKPVAVQLSGHVRPVRGLGWSASSRYLVSWDDVGELLVWDPDLSWSRRRLETDRMRLPYSGIHALDVRAGRLAAAGAFEAESYACVVDDDSTEQAFEGAGTRFSSCVFLSDSVLALGGTRALYIWHLGQSPPAEPSYRLPDDGTVSHLAASPDGERLAAVDDAGILRVFEVAALIAEPSAEPSLTIDRHRGTRMSSVAWSPDGRALVATRPSGGFVRVDAATGSSELFDDSPKTPARCTAFHPSLAFFVTGDDHGALRLWEAGSGRLLGELPNAHVGRIYALAFDPSGELLCTGDSVGRVRVWYVAELPASRPETLPVPIFSFDTPHTEVFDVEFLGPDRLLTAGSTVGIVEWDFAALDRYIAGNLEHWVERLGAAVEAEAVARLRAWKAARPAGG